MSNSYIENLDSETRDVINYLKNRPEICDLKIDEFPGVTQAQLNEWEIKNLCSLPNDIRQFFQAQNGMKIEWKFLVDTDQTIPLGRIQINSLKEMTRVGTVLNKDFREPSLFDLEELQVPPPKQDTLKSKSTSTFSTSSLMSLGTDFSNISLKNKILENEQEKELTEIIKSAQIDKNLIDEASINDNGSSSDLENDNNDDEEASCDISNLVPHFGEASNNFELDNCNGFGKVCLVYRNGKSVTSSENNTEIWFLDRSLQWHYLTDTFQNYYRLLIAHLGLPQWQALFTEDGLPPFLYQWYYMLAPGRILIHDNNWKKLQFLSMFENNGQNKSKNQQIKTSSVSVNKIDFNKLFDDKLQKNKSQNNKAAMNNAIGTNSKTIASIKPKSRNSIKK